MSRNYLTRYPAVGIFVTRRQVRAAKRLRAVWRTGAMSRGGGSLSGSVCLPIVQRRSSAGARDHVPSRGAGISGQLDLDDADTDYWCPGSRMWDVVRGVIERRHFDRASRGSRPEHGPRLSRRRRGSVLPGRWHPRCTSWQQTDRGAITKRVPECTTDHKIRGTGTGWGHSVPSTRIIGPTTRWARGSIPTGWRRSAVSVPTGESGSSNVAIVEGSSATRRHHRTRGAFGDSFPVRIDWMQDLEAGTISEPSTCRSPNR